MLKVAISSDHAGYNLKEFLKNHLKDIYQIVDLGCDSDHSCDYPDYAKKMAEFIKEHKDYRGILLCGTGIGISIAANRYSHIRAALCHNSKTAKLAREHNDANILALGARIVSKEEVTDIIDTFLQTKFTQDIKHIKRIDKI